MAIPLSLIINNLNSIESINTEFTTNFNSKEKTIEILGITDIPWEVKPGYCYVCLEFEEFSSKFKSKTSADLYELAIQNGAVLLAISKNNKYFIDKKYPNINIIKCNNLNKITGYLAREIYSNPFDKMEIIGITGTKGKTTTTKLIDSILLKNKDITGIIGTNGIYYPHHFEEVDFLSNPHSIELFKIASKFKKQIVNKVVMELTSHGAIYERNSAIEFNIVLMTNITSDHLDFHYNIKNYKQAKLLYFKRLFQQDKPATAIINIDDPASLEFYDFIKINAPNHIKILTFGVNNSNANIKGRIINVYGSGTIFEFDINKRYQDKIELKIPGIFNVHNSLAAISACYALNIPLKTIKFGLESVTGIPGRFEKIANKFNFDIIVDYAHTADSLKNLLYNIRLITTNRVITIFGCGGNRDRTKRPKMGEIAYNLSDIIIITSDNPRFEDPKAIIDEIKSGIIQKNNKKIIIEIDRKKAIEIGLKMMNKNTTLVVAGKGHEKYQVIKDKTIFFSDAITINELMKNV